MITSRLAGRPRSSLLCRLCQRQNSLHLGPACASWQLLGVLSLCSRLFSAVFVRPLALTRESVRRRNGGSLADIMAGEFLREGIEQRAAFLRLDWLPSHFRAAHSLCQARGLGFRALKLMLGLGGPL
jgi:hypothetical protein